jgi:hypothetical protein
MSRDIQRVVAGLPWAWAGFLADRDRSLRSGNYPTTTRYNYLLAATQLARYLGNEPGASEPGGAAETPIAVTRQHVEAFRRG